MSWELYWGGKTSIICLKLTFWEMTQRNILVSWGVISKSLGVQKDTQMPCWLRLWVEVLIVPKLFWGIFWPGARCSLLAWWRPALDKSQYRAQYKPATNISFRTNFPCWASSNNDFYLPDMICGLPEISYITYSRMACSICYGFINDLKTIFFFILLHCLHISMYLCWIFCIKMCVYCSENQLAIRARRI